MTAILLSLSMILSVSRNLFSKNLSKFPFGSKDFFHLQALLFAFGAVTLFLFGSPTWSVPSPPTWMYACIYGGFLILAQWFYTLALGKGNTALCSTVYSMGFVLPTLSGAIVWAEPFSFLDLVGILCAIAAILCSKDFSKEKTNTGKGCFLPLMIATISSGGLGILQKMQQSSDVADERAAFLIIAFLLASLLSFFTSLTTQKKKKHRPSYQAFALSAGVGIAFSACNLLNTILAGQLPSAIFFPTLNIGVILMTLLSGLLFFKEHLRRKEISVLIFGALSILLLNIS